MIPGTYNIEIYQGDTYYGPQITLPSLAPFGGPSNLTTATVEAQIRPKVSAEPVATFDVDVIDAALRQVRLTLAPEDTAPLNLSRSTGGVWDLQVTEGDWVGTPLAGKVTLFKEVTRPVPVVP